jgi:hypothetical protein
VIEGKAILLYTDASRNIKFALKFLGSGSTSFISDDIFENSENILLG